MPSHCGRSFRGKLYQLPAGAEEDAKKQETAAFIKRKKAIKTVEVMKELLCNLILEAVEPAYYAELEHYIYKCDHIEPRDLLNHLVKHYAKIDDQMIKDNYTSFTEASDLIKPIDVYFRKQERCQCIGKTGLVNTFYTK